MDEIQAQLPSLEATPAPSEPRSIEIRFTGSGSEYFRIWIVNMLLTVLTLSLYHPWAKLRRLRYFHGNTLVGGHALDFHGDPKKMLRGHLLVGAMLGIYTLATHASPVAALVAVAVLSALWPALMRASLQFRLANTSWRGLRMHFSGSLGGAYSAMLPLALPVLLAVALPLAVSKGAPRQAPSAWFWVVLVALLASLAAMPWMLWRLKRYQLAHTEFGGQRGSLRTGPGAYYWLSFTGGLLTIATMLSMAVIAYAVLSLGRGGASTVQRDEWVALAATVSVVVTYATVFVTTYPYYVSRMQNLVWNATTTEDLQFGSALRFRSMLLLSVRNLVLMLLTLGLYWPFARVATARLRLEAVDIRSRIDPDDLASADGLVRPEATGDAAGDLFGIDFGL